MVPVAMELEVESVKHLRYISAIMGCPVEGAWEKRYVC